MLPKLQLPTLFSTSNGGEISNYFQRRVELQFWQHGETTAITLSLPFSLSGHAREFHPCVPPEPYVKVSLHTALHVNNHAKIHIYQIIMYFLTDVPIANGQISQGFLCIGFADSTRLFASLNPFPI